MIFLVWALVVVSAGAAVAYLITVERGPYPARAAVKGAAVGSLALVAALHGAWLLAAAFALCTLGDVFLAEREGRRFLYGLLAFLAGHAVFVALFVQRFPHAPIVVPLGPIVVGVSALSFGAWLFPRLHRMRPAVLGYLVVIALMVSSTFVARVSPWVRVGAVCFAVSDAIIAVTEFHRRWRGARMLNWALYYAGQALIAYGLLGAS